MSAGQCVYCGQFAYEAGYGCRSCGTATVEDVTNGPAQDLEGLAEWITATPGLDLPDSDAVKVAVAVREYMAHIASRARR